jgi:sugar fermentation stimulation protein A
MRLPPLTRGRILRRYKRFLADVELADGQVVTAHCPNTGSMTGCWTPGAAVELSRSDNPRRKLAYTLERVDMGAGWVGVNTGIVNAVVAEGIAAGRIGPLAGYGGLRREVVLEAPGHPRSRIDLRLTDGGAVDAWVEVKNTTLLLGAAVAFPDAVTERGRKHLGTLLHAVQGGERGVMLFAVNRPEGERFAPAWDIDPAYAERLAEVAARGVEVLAVRLVHTPSGIEVGDGLPVDVGRRDG